MRLAFFIPGEHITEPSACRANDLTFPMRLTIFVRECTKNMPVISRQEVFLPEV